MAGEFANQAAMGEIKHSQDVANAVRKRLRAKNKKFGREGGWICTCCICRGGGYFFEIKDNTPFIFIGEERSKRAKKMGVRWEDGRLAAKTLFDALKAVGVNPEQCQFFNLFECGGDEKLEDAVNSKVKIVAMGKKVHNALRKKRIPHIELIHPAARGTIRKKSNYQNHVAERLNLPHNKT